MSDDPHGYDPRVKYCPPDGPYDERLRMRHDNLYRAIRAVCTDWPATDPMPETDPDD